MFALDLLNQFQSYNGTLLAAGKIYVYKLGRTELAPVYGDHNGATVIANPVILDDQGMAEIYLNDAFNYTIVVFDAYGQEQFSRDIYPSGMGKGESIGTQLYEGIDPIVVNNDVYAISANTTKLGVQDPLYFVQDDAERVIIGFSGQTDVPPGTMNESAFGYEDGQITSYNGSAFSAGLNYVAGDNIVIDGNEIALDSAITLVDQSHTKGMQLDATEQQFTNLTGNKGAILDANGLYVSDLNQEHFNDITRNGITIQSPSAQIQLITDDDNPQQGIQYSVESEDKTASMIANKDDIKLRHLSGTTVTAIYSLTGACSSAQSAIDIINSSDLTQYSASDNIDITDHVISGKDWSSEISDASANAYNQSTAWTDSQGYLTGVDLHEYAKTDFVVSSIDAATSGKYDTSSFSAISGSFLTAHQSLDGLMSADLLEISNNKITGYNGTAFAGQGGVSGDFTLVEGNGIQLTDDPIAQTTTISVSGDYATNTQLQTVSADITAMIPTALTGDYLDKASADTLYYPLNSNPNNYLTGLPADVAYTGWVENSIVSATSGLQPSGNYLTTGDLTGKQDITGMTAYATVESLTAKQDAGSYLSSTDSANFLLTSDSGNFYPMNENPAGYLTAHQSLADYQLTADMTGYLTTADSANFLTAVPDTYLQNTDLTISDGKITEISGVPLSAGDELPSGLMNESAVEYNAVNEISGYNGSAIAQYGAEKQWLVHDDTLVHAANSAQYALGVNLSAVAQLLGVDETVLWSGARQTTGTIQLSESMWNYNTMDIYVCPDYNTYSARMGYQITRLTVIPQIDNNEQLLCYAKSNRIASNTYLSELFYLRFNPDGSSVDFSPGIKWSNNTVTTGVTAFTGAVTKIVGIGRKS